MPISTLSGLPVAPIYGGTVAECISSLCARRQSLLQSVTRLQLWPRSPPRAGPYFFPRRRRTRAPALRRAASGQWCNCVGQHRCPFLALGAWLTYRRTHCRYGGIRPYSACRCDRPRFLLPRFWSATPGLMPYPPPKADTHRQMAFPPPSSICHHLRLDFGPVIGPHLRMGPLFCPDRSGLRNDAAIASNAWLTFRLRVCASRRPRR